MSLTRIMNTSRASKSFPIQPRSLLPQRRTIAASAHPSKFGPDCAGKPQKPSGAVGSRVIANRPTGPSGKTLVPGPQDRWKRLGRQRDVPLREEQKRKARRRSHQGVLPEQLEQNSAQRRPLAVHPRCLTAINWPCSPQPRVIDMVLMQIG